MRPGARREAERAVSGAFFLGAGQAGMMAVGLAMTLVMPRVLGAADFGQWVMYRSIINLMLGLDLLGTHQVMSRFYIGRVAEGDPLAARRIFKTILVVRLATTVVTAGVGAWLLLRAEFALSSVGAAGMLAGSTLFQGAEVVMLHLLYGERRMRSIAAIHVLQAGMAPLAVTAAYVLRGLAWAPAACLAADGVCAGLAVLLACPWQAWAPGWLPLRECRSLLVFGGVAAVAASALQVFAHFLPYLMHLLGYDMQAIGHAGLARRVGAMASGALASVGSGLFPSLVFILQQDGLGRAVRWQQIATRLGTLVLVLGAGLFMVLGRGLTPLLFGSEFSAAAPALGLGLAAAVAKWWGSQDVRITLLLGKPSLHLPPIAALFAVFAIALRPWQPAGTATTALQAVLAGSLAYGLVFHWLLRSRYGVDANLVRYVPLCLPLLVPAVWAWRCGGAGGSVAAAVGWLVFYPLVALAGGGIRSFEITEILGLVRRPRAPAPAAPPDAE